jgi:cytochrome P450
VKDEAIKKRLLAELDENMKECGATSVKEFLTLENMSNLPYLQMCMNEGLRMDPPVSRSTSMMTTEDVNVGSFTIKGGDIFTVDMFNMCRNPD